MKQIWLKEDEQDTVAVIPDGCKLSEYENTLLMKLAGNLSTTFLRGAGFSEDDIKIIHNWYRGI